MSNTLHHFISAVEVSSAVEFGDVQDLTTSARGGERGGGTILVSDPTGVFNIRGWNPYYSTEPASTTAPRVFTGYIAGKRIGRGGKYPSGPGRVWTCTLVDLNAVFKLRALRGSDCKRPAETNLERIAWLLAKSKSAGGLSGLLADTGYVQDSHPRPFEGADYTDQWAENVLDDVSGIIGRDYFAWWDPNSAEPSLFYDVRDVAVNNCTLKISNVPGDADDVTVFSTGSSGGDEDGVLDRDADAVYPGLVFKFTRGKVYVNDPDVADTFIGRDDVIDNSRVSTRATALLMANSYIAAHATEKDVLTIPTRIPADKIGLIDAGQRIQVKQEHLPGYESAYVWTRIAQRTMTQRELAFYDLVLTCTLAAPASKGGGPGTGEFPHPPAGVPDAPDFADNHGSGSDGTLSSAPVIGDQLVLFVASRLATGVPGTPTGWTKEADCHTTDNNGVPVTKYAALFSKISDGTETDQPYSGNPGELLAIWNFGPDVEIGGVVIVNDANTSVLNCGSVSIPGPGYVYGCVIESTADFTSTATTPGAGVTEDADFQIAGVQPFLWAGHRTLTAATTTAVTGTVTNSASRNFWGAISFYAVSTAEANPPTPGQTVPWTVVTMTPSGGVSVGTAGFSYAAGSLQVKVDGVPISTASYTETNPATGQFALTWLLDGDETVTITYQAGSGPLQSVVTLTSADSASTFLTHVADLTVDVIELAAGSYDWDDVEIDVDRTSRPLTIRPVAGATVTFVGSGSTSSGIFFFGLTSQTSWITMDGSAGRFVFDGISLAQAGVFEIRSSSHLTIRGCTFRNLVQDHAVSGHGPQKSWCGYISKGGTRNNANLSINDWIAESPADNRDLSFIQIASGLANGLISITNVSADGYYYAFYDEEPVTSLTLADWTLNDCGNAGAGDSMFVDAVVVNGSYSTIVATSSLPLHNNSTGSFASAGGNSGI